MSENALSGFKDNVHMYSHSALSPPPPPSHRPSHHLSCHQPPSPPLDTPPYHIHISALHMYGRHWNIAFASLSGPRGDLVVSVACSSKIRNEGASPDAGSPDHKGPSKPPRAKQTSPSRGEAPKPAAKV